jgi:hypothetical protein
MKKPSGGVVAVNIILLGFLTGMLFPNLFQNHPTNRKAEGNVLPFPLPATSGMPPVTASYYEGALLRPGLPGWTAQFAMQGCVEAQTSPTQQVGGQAVSAGLIILDWGQIDDSLGTHGTYDFRGNVITNDQIAQAIEAFLTGLWSCRTHRLDFDIAIGLSNYGPCFCNDPNDPVETQSGWYQSGVAWGKLVNQVQNFVVQSKMTSDLIVDGADDLEEGIVFDPGWDQYQSWGTAYHSIAFVDGYDNATDQLLYDFGDDEGINADIPGSESYSAALALWNQNMPHGGNDWTRQNLWYIAFGAKDVLPVPEIYYRPMATYDWEPLSIWACKNKGQPILFIALMNEYPYYDSASPPDEWGYMTDALNSDACTKPMLSKLLFITRI